MEQCEFCGNTVAHVNEAEACNACAASMTLTAVKQEAKKAVEDKDNQEYMLAYFGITLEQFDAVTHDNLSNIVDSDFVSWYKNDAKRVLWHEYRANAFTKKGALKKVAEKKIKNNLDSFVADEPKPEPTPIKRSAGKQKALDNAADARSTAKLFGAKALTGSAKQKSWGEALRKAFIERVQNEAVLDAMLTNNDAQKAKFWIETRELGHQMITDILLGAESYSKAIEKSEAISRVKKIIKGHGSSSSYAQAKVRELNSKYGVSL